MKKKFIKWLFKEIVKNPETKKEFVNILLSDTLLGFNIFNNSIKGVEMYNNTITLSTTRDIILDEVILPKGVSLQIIHD